MLSWVARDSSIDFRSIRDCLSVQVNTFAFHMLRLFSAEQRESAAAAAGGRDVDAHRRQVRGDVLARNRRL